ncbi:MAG: respiratory nitrate reductase subunit gamma [Trebonia sp.]
MFSVTTRNDKAMYVLLILTLGLGLGTTVIGTVTGHPHDYRLTVAPWFRSVFYFHPDTQLILNAPICYRLHVLSAWALFAFWPFSRLVHVFSAPLGYLTRPCIPYRSRRPAARRAGPPARLGTGPVTVPAAAGTVVRAGTEVGVTSPGSPGPGWRSRCPRGR